MRNSRQCGDWSSQRHTWTPPVYNYLPGDQSSSGQSQTERREVSSGRQRPAERLHLQHFAVLSSIYLSANWHWFHLHAIFRTFGSALVSLQHLSNKSGPASLFNKHFAPSDECAALLKCLFSFCLGGQPTVVYLTVNKGPEKSTTAY